MSVEWRIYQGDDKRTSPEELNRWLETPPPWRRGRTQHVLTRSSGEPVDEITEWRGRNYHTTGADELIRVNMALLLRRPLLVTGRPGIGKTTLAYNIAWCLGLGAPLRWEINSQSTLRDGLYAYDAVGHLQASQGGGSAEIGRFVTLGPLGTALLPTDRPRVLLIDELDKASYDLPHDLLHVFEEGTFTIPELIRTGGDQRVYPFDAAGEEDRVAVQAGRISTKHYPVVVVTSNGEREFPEAFLRRCVPLTLEVPTGDVLAEIVRRQLGSTIPPEVLRGAIEQFKDQTTDVLLQALFLQNRFGVDEQAVLMGLRR